MWSFMSLPLPSFPHTLHRSANLLEFGPLAILLWLFSIINFTFSSSASKSPEKLLGMANVLISPIFLQSVRMRPMLQQQWRFIFKLIVFDLNLISRSWLLSLYNPSFKRPWNTGWVLNIKLRLGKLDPAPAATSPWGWFLPTPRTQQHKVKLILPDQVVKL